MIKFNFLIHKETGTVINYKVWLKSFKENLQFRFRKMDLYEELVKYSRPYNPIELLTSDDFEIIYDSEFSNLELITLFGNCATSATQLKLKKIIDGNINLKRRYGIEV